MCSFIVVSRFFAGSESGCMRFENQAFGMRHRIPKKNFHRSWISHDSTLYFSLFWVASGLNLMILAAVEHGFKFDDVSGCFWLRLNWAVPGP